MAASMWNARVLIPPPNNYFDAVSWKIDKDGAETFQNFVLSVSRVHEWKKTQFPVLQREIVTLGRLLYKHKNAMKHWKFYSLLTGVQKCLNRIADADFFLYHRALTAHCNSLDDVQTQISPSVLKLPSRQMLEYFLIRLQGYSKLCIYIADTCEQTALILLDSLQQGFFINMNMVLIALISRIRVLISKLLKSLINWYDSLIPWRAQLPSAKSQWLAEGTELSNNLMEWLGDDALKITNIFRKPSTKTGKPDLLDSFFDSSVEGNASSVNVDELTSSSSFTPQIADLDLGEKLTVEDLVALQNRNIDKPDPKRQREDKRKLQTRPEIMISRQNKYQKIKGLKISESNWLQKKNQIVHQKVAKTDTAQKGMTIAKLVQRQIVKKGRVHMRLKLQNRVTGTHLLDRSTKQDLPGYGAAHHSMPSSFSSRNCAGKNVKGKKLVSGRRMIDGKKGNVLKKLQRTSERVFKRSLSKESASSSSSQKLHVHQHKKRRLNQHVQKLRRRKSSAKDNYLNSLVLGNTQASDFTPYKPAKSSRLSANSDVESHRPKQQIGSRKRNFFKDASQGRKGAPSSNQDVPNYSDPPSNTASASSHIRGNQNLEQNISTKLSGYSRKGRILKRLQNAYRKIRGKEGKTKISAVDSGLHYVNRRIVHHSTPTKHYRELHMQGTIQQHQGGHQAFSLNTNQAKDFGHKGLHYQNPNGQKVKQTQHSQKHRKEQQQMVTSSRHSQFSLGPIQRHDQGNPQSLIKGQLQEYKGHSRGKSRVGLRQSQSYPSNFLTRQGHNMKLSQTNDGPSQRSSPVNHTKVIVRTDKRTYTKHSNEKKCDTDKELDDIFANLV